MRVKKLVGSRKSRTRSHTGERPRRQKTMIVRLGRLGTHVREIKLRVGTAMKDLISSEGLAQCSVRLNGRPFRLSASLKNGDVVTATPQSIRGTSAGRFDHLDLDECRRTMAPRDYEFFVNFVGAETLGVRNEDLEVC